MTSQRLGQTEAFEVLPSKKLIVRPGHTAWWGVDPSTLRVAIAVVEQYRGGPWRRSAIVAFDPSVPVVERLPEIRLKTREMAVRLMCDDHGPDDRQRPSLPGVIVMEKPAGFGDRPNPELAYGAGAVLCGLVEAVKGMGVKVVLVEGSKWKKLACGRGDIKKPKPSSGEQYAVVTWARTVGFTGNSWDEADAWGVAEYARRTYMLEQR